jgi:uncharacterized protein YfaS (alpha-2-macroglobulin family)
LLKGTNESFIYLSRNACGALARDYSYLVQYPHGCLEQTVSAAFPQIYFPEMLKQVLPKTNIGVMSPEFNVRQAIMKIEALQLYDGGFMYWPGYNDYNWWSSVYATHFLYEARKAGFDVSKQVTDKAVKYLQEMVKKGVTRNYYNNGVFAARENAYSLYVLALYGVPDFAQMNYYKANPSLLLYDSKYILAAAFALAGDRKSYEHEIPKTGDFGEYERLTGLDYSSPIRNRAIVLSALVEVDPTNPKIVEFSEHLRKMINKESWISTQEAAFSFIAFGKLAKSSANSTAQAKVYVGGKSVGQMKDADITLRNNDLTQNVRIDASGSGLTYYSWESSGIPVSGFVKEEDVNLKVRRNLYDRFGTRLSGPIKAGDLVVVEILLTSDGSDVDNVAVTDILPACFEIENPRLTAERGYNWIKNASDPDYIDMRDDRINIYTSLSKYACDKKFYYQVRVTARGEFREGPVSADAMYDGQIRSYNGAGKILVK